MTKIEQLGAGSIYCQIFDVIYPGKVPLNKVKWKAKLEYDF
jgi:RP/EB family microtubule-associated protein